MDVRVSGRVISVVPVRTGRYAVTVGPAPHVFFFYSAEPPRLGSELRISAGWAARSDVSVGNRSGSVTLLDEVRAKEMRGIYARRIVPAVWYDRVARVMRRPLYRYQMEGAAWIASRLASGRGALLGDDPGLGKTAAAIAAICATKMLPAIVVCPMSIKKNWEREIGWAAYDLSVSIVSGQRGTIMPADIVIINYDLLAHYEQPLCSLMARTIVFDEAQWIKEPRPRPKHRAAVATRIAHWIGRAILLTGTPVENRPQELWRLLHVADKVAWPSLDAYERRYCRAPSQDDRRRAVSYGRVENVDELQARIQPVMLRRLKSEVLRDLPPMSRRSILVQLEPATAQEYRAADKDFVAWLRAHASSVEAVRAAKAHALSKLTKLRYLAVMGKLRKAVPEYIGQWFDRSSIEPLVIFAYHRDAVFQLYLIGRRLGLRVTGIGAGDSPEKRQAAVDDFQEGHYDIFVAPIRAAGVGINLQGRAADALFVERVWVPAHLTQAEGRLHRIGALRPVTATYLDAADTVDVRLAAVVEAKQKLALKVVGDRQDDGGAAEEVVDEIVRGYLADDSRKEAS